MQKKTLLCSKPMMVSASILLATVLAYFLSLELVIVKPENAMMLLRSGQAGQPSALAMLLAKLRCLGSGFTVSGTLVGTLLALFIYQTIKRKYFCFSWTRLFISLGFGLCMMAGLSMEQHKSLSFLTASGFQRVIGLFCILSWAFVMYLALLWLYAAFERHWTVRPAQKASKALQRLWAWNGQHDTLACFLLIGLCWLPWLVGFYPGCVNWDTFVQLERAFGLWEMSNHAPAYLTWFTAAFVQLGRTLFGSDNIGIYLSFIVQNLVFAYAMAFELSFLKRLHAPRWLCGASLAFFCLVPIWGAYSVMGHKDTLYTAATVLFAVWTARYLFTDERFTFRENAGYALSTVMMCLITAFIS